MDNSGGLKLSSFFSPKHVLCHVEGVSREECLRRMVEVLRADGKVKNADEVLEAVLQREKLQSTQLAVGLAIPHTRLSDIDTLSMAVATSRDGIDCGSAEHGPAHVVMLVLTPISQPSLYLQALAGVVNLFALPDVLKKVARFSKPEMVWDFFDKGLTTLPQYVTAHDMMSTDFVGLKTVDYLERAIDLFAYEHLLDIPVVDEDGDLVGIMNEEQLLRLALPEYILWIEDLSPILHFEPFAELLSNERTLRIGEVMSNEYATVTEDAPAIQVARTLMQRVQRAVLVTRGKKLVGVIRLSDFLTKVLRK